MPAAKPTILSVDDDPQVLRAVERDLKKHFAAKYRVLSADSADSGLQTLRELEQRGDAVALLLVDQRMPGKTGVEFLTEAKPLAPEARRVLLTAYADTDAAIGAINDAGVDHYLLKPWDPPEEKLYPVLDDLLDDWQAAFRPSFSGIRVVGHRFSPRSHAIKDYLSRRQVPFQWVDVEALERPGDSDARRLATLIGSDAGCLPVVLFEDGSRIVQPTVEQIAEKIGLKRNAERPFYDLVIVGGGPAGLAAAVYGGSEGLSTLMIEKEAPGGQAGTSSRIENYLGFPGGVSGAELARRATAQAQRFGVESLARTAQSVRVEGPYRIVTLGGDGGGEVSCHALIVATGVAWRKLEVPGIDTYTGAGVYYGAALTEASSCSEEDVYIVGGANSAGQGAMYFSRFARRVIMLVRGDDLRKGMSDYLVDQIGGTPNIEVRTQTRLVGVDGDGDRLDRITIADDANGGATETVPASSLFIFIGAEPHTEWLQDLLTRDDHGFLLTGPDLPQDERTHQPVGWPLERDPYVLETNVPGIFVAGDVRFGSVKRVASSVGEGGVAVSLIHRYLSSVR